MRDKRLLKQKTDRLRTPWTQILENKNNTREMPLSSKTASGTSGKINVLRKSSAVIVVFMSLLATAVAKEWSPSEWPALKHYDSGHLQQIALPLGGIGTGTVSLGGRGELRDWEIMNVPAKGYSTVTPGNNAPFFAINIRGCGDTPVSALLCGPLYDNEYLHYEGRPVNHHGLPRFSSASFDAAYPFGQVNLSDDDMPVEVRIKGFNPLIPGDASWTSSRDNTWPTYADWDILRTRTTSGLPSRAS